jgi:hypothetical protein
VGSLPRPQEGIASLPIALGFKRKIKMMKINGSLQNVATFILALAPIIGHSQTLISFDDLHGWPWPNPYNGLTWNNFLPENVPAVTAEFGPSGYEAGMISSPNVVYNGSGNPASITRSGAFDFDSAYMTAAIMDNLQLEVKGYLNGVLKYDNTYTLSATSPTLIHFNDFYVDTVDLITSGGTPHGYPNFAPGEVFAMDNLTVNLSPVPEPSMVELLSVGIIALLVRRRRLTA